MLIGWWLALIFFASLSIVLTLVFVSNLVALFQTQVPYVPLSKKRLENLKKLVSLPSDSRLVDLGCGDGRVLRMFESTGVRELIGYELNVWACLKARIINRFLKSKVKIRCANFLKIDLSQYNVVFCYLFPGMMVKLKEKFESEMKPGTKIISFAFPILGWREPVQIHEIVLSKNNVQKIYIYQL